MTATAVTSWSRLHGGQLHPGGELLAAVERFAAADQAQILRVQDLAAEIEAARYTATPEKMDQLVGAFGDLTPDDRELDRMLHEIACIPAHTANGRSAKARVVQRWIGEGWDTMRVPLRDPWERVAWSLAQDALNAGAVA